MPFVDILIAPDHDLRSPADRNSANYEEARISLQKTYRTQLQTLLQTVKTHHFAKTQYLHEETLRLAQKERERDPRIAEFLAAIDAVYADPDISDYDATELTDLLDQLTQHVKIPTADTIRTELHLLDQKRKTIMSLLRSIHD